MNFSFSAVRNIAILLISCSVLVACDAEAPSLNAPLESADVPQATRDLHYADASIQGFLRGCLSSQPPSIAIPQAFPEFEFTRSSRFGSFGGFSASRRLPRYSYQDDPAAGVVSIDLQNRRITTQGANCSVMIQSHYARDGSDAIAQWLSAGNLPGRAAGRPATAPDPEIPGVTRYWQRPNGRVIEITAGNARVGGNNATVLSMIEYRPRPCMPRTEAEDMASRGFDTSVAIIKDSCP